MNIIKVLPELFTPSTLLISVLLIIVPALGGLILAILITYLKIRRVPFLSQLATLYVSFTRSVPSVLQLFLTFYVLPLVVNTLGIVGQINSLAAALLGLSLYHSGYLAEIIRPAYLAVGKEQHEAAASLGYTPLKSLTKIIVPQLIPIALPGWGNSLIYLVHNSALVMYIGVMDVMAQAHAIMEGQYNQYQLTMYFILALFYCLLCLIIRLFVGLLENKFAKYHLGTGIIEGGH